MNEILKYRKIFVCQAVYYKHFVISKKDNIKTKQLIMRTILKLIVKMINYEVIYCG